jgi:chitinase
MKRLGRRTLIAVAGGVLSGITPTERASGDRSVPSAYDAPDAPSDLSILDDSGFRVVGYYPAYRADEYPPERVSFEAVTDVVYAFLKPTADGTVVNPAYYGDGALSALPDGRPDTRFHLSIGGGGFSEHFSEIAADREKRARFASTAVDLVCEYGFDGINVDWEYPSDPTDAENFGKLLEACRARLERADGTYRLTIAAGHARWSTRYLPHRKLANVVDYVYVMSYDYHGPWSDETGFNAPLRTEPPSLIEAILELLRLPTGRREPPRSIDGSMRMWVDEWNVPADMLVVGVPFYGRGFAGVPAENRGLGQPFEGVPLGGGGGAIPYSNVATRFLDDPDYERYRDETAKVPWLYSDEESVFVSYDDPRSVGRKANYARREGFAGLMIWELTQDRDGKLLGAIAERT